MLGQIATFIENLHLTYNEVVNVIPYRNLSIMMADKLHTIYEDGKTKKESDVIETFKEL